jgi:hypothetical protein
MAVSIDPVIWAQELFVCVAIVILGGLAYKYRRNLMLFFTGDEVFHINVLECIWWTLTCNGDCAGEWTRCLTKCPCLPKRWRGVNLVRKAGQLAGLTPTPVEIKNIVVGDLPISRKSNIYITVQCSANPEMATSVAEMAHPKVIHYPEVFTLRVRNSPLENSVRIQVKALNIVGSEDVATCHIDAMRVLDWASEAEEHDRTKRFELKCADPTYSPLTPPWVMVEFDHPTEVRDLEHFNPNRQTIRTGIREDGTYNDMQISDFKGEYQLVNTAGGPVCEIEEASLGGLQRLNDCCRCIGWCFTLWATLFITVFLVVRSYVWTCWWQIKWLAIADMHHAHFPINHYNLTRLLTRCEREVEGTGLQKGDSPCLPTDDRVIEFCKPEELDGGEFPSIQPRPHAFEHQIKRYTTFEVEVIPCDWRACAYQPMVAEWDRICFGIVLLTPLALCFFKTCSRSVIRNKVNSLKNFGVAHPEEVNTRSLSRREPREENARSTRGGGYDYVNVGCW